MNLKKLYLRRSVRQNKYVQYQLSTAIFLFLIYNKLYMYYSTIKNYGVPV